MARNVSEGKTNAEGRFEAESLAFHSRVRQGFLDQAARSPERICIVDARGAPEEIALRVWALVEGRLHA